MCFLPNSRASMDQAPGPTIARTAPRTPCTMGIHGSPECGKCCEKAIDNLTMAASAPATGVHRPIKRRIPAPIPVICKTTVGKGGASRRPTVPKWMSAAPVSSRNSRSPVPGQPSAKPENSRCTILRYECKRFATESKHPKLGAEYPTFGGSTIRSFRASALW